MNRSATGKGLAIDLSEGQRTLVVESLAIGEQTGTSSMMIEVDQ